MCHKVASEFFATNAPDPPRWALNSCFGAFRSVWMHFGLFCYCTKLDTKWAELVQLMQNFVPRSRIGIFCNVPIHPIGPKTHFLCVSLFLGSFWIVLLLHEASCKMGSTGAISAKVRATTSHQNFFATNAPDPPRWALNSCFGAFRSVRMHFGLFRYCTKLDTKWTELLQLMQKFVPRSCI